MAEERNGATPVERVALPGELVELAYLKDVDGQPVKVLVKPIPEFDLLKITQGLPGGHVKDADQTPPGTEEHWTEEEVEQMLPWARAVLDRGCTSPRFWFASPVEGAIEGIYLRAVDQVRLLITTLRVSGFLGGAAVSAASFHAGERAGRSGGDGADGNLPAAAAAPSAAGA